MTRRRDALWAGQGYNHVGPVGTVYWLYPTQSWPGGFVRRINRMGRLPVSGVEEVALEDIERIYTKVAR